MPITPICSICCDYFTPNCILKTTECGHIFHSQCILRWLKNTSNCPECRRFGTVLHRVYLNFNDTANEGADLNETLYKIQQKQIETLMMKLSMEETKNKSTDQRLHELIRKLRDQLKAAKAKDEQLSLALENAKKSRQAAEEAEKLLRKEILALKQKQQQEPTSTSSIKLLSRGTNASTVIKQGTSTCIHRTVGIKIQRAFTSTTTSTSKSTNSSLSLSATSRTSTSTSAKISHSRDLSTPRSVGENVTSRRH